MTAIHEFDTVVVAHDYGNIRGGQEKVAIESALGLAAAGIDVVFFCACGPVDPRLEPSGIRVVCLDMHDIKSNPSVAAAARRGIWNGEAAKRFEALLAEYDPAKTIIHVHGWTKALSASIGPVVATKGRRHVYTMHEYFLACPNGGFFNYPKNEICTYRAMGPKCISSNCDQRSYSQKLFRVARQYVANVRGKLPDGLRNVIYISTLQKEVIAPYLPKAAALHSVPNPISIDQSPRIEVEKNTDFVFVGRLEPVKGATDFAAAAAAADIPAVFVGDGKDAEAVRSLNGDAVITGWVTPDRVADMIRSARCLVFPSHWYECQPLVPYEALSMGVPVITYDVSAAREAVEKGVNGDIVPFSDRTRAFPKALMNFTDPATARLHSQNAYARYWQDPLTLERHVRRLVEVYSGIAA